MARKKFKKGDLVILVDDERPDTRKKKLGLPHKKNGHEYRQKFAYIDRVDKLKRNKAVTKHHKFKTDKLQSNKEDPTDKQKRLNKGHPERKIYFVDTSFFQLPNGMVIDLEGAQIDVDVVTLDAIIKSFDNGQTE